MKHILTIVLCLICAALIVALFLTKQNATAQFATDAAAFNECSNTMVAVQSQVAAGNGTITVLSNSLNEWQSTSASFSNRLVAAQDTIALGAGQITNLTQQVAGLESENQALNQQTMVLTNQLNSQIDALNQKVTLTETNLAAVQRDHVLLEERLRRDVGERLLIQRQFYNLDALQAQMDKLKSYGGSLDVTADKIYAGLDVEVRSNGSIHVLAPE